MLQRVQTGRTAQPVVLYGLRGVGKTVLLSRFSREADDRDWIFAQVEAGAGRSLRQALSPGGGADTGLLETDLAKLVRDLSAAAGKKAPGWPS